jgi:hypothetical protein
MVFDMETVRDMETPRLNEGIDNPSTKLLEINVLPVLVRNLLTNNDRGKDDERNNWLER